MEQRFFINEFEQSLREQADQFQMVPSKKVWHGIYNDLHPGRKWPSIAMSLSLIFTLVVIGHLHTHNQHTLAAIMNSNKINKISAIEENINQIEKNNQRNPAVNNSQTSNNQRLAARESVANTVSPTDVRANISSNNLSDKTLASENSSAENNLASSSLKKTLTQSESENKNTYAGKSSGIDYADSKEGSLPYYEDVSIVINDPISVNISQNFNHDDQLEKVGVGKDHTRNEVSLKTKNIDKAALNTKVSDANKITQTKTHRKRNENINWVYYAAPVINNVSFSGEFLKETSTVNFTPVLQQVNQKENKVIHNAALGFEAGAQMNYALDKRLKFTTGIHLTYSGYNIRSNQVHPTQSNLVLKDPTTGMTYIQSYLTHYGDGTGLAVTTLHNYSWQASIPVGLQYAFYNNNKLQVSLSADIEPSFVLKGNSFILSSDGNNYVNDPSLLRKWNFNSNFGTFVTFSSARFHWQIGPNVRYQWLSTYQREYTVKEHLIDYGIRIGISKNK